MSAHPELLWSVWFELVLSRSHTHTHTSSTGRAVQRRWESVSIDVRCYRNETSHRVRVAFRYTPFVHDAYRSVSFSDTQTRPTLLLTALVLWIKKIGGQERCHSRELSVSFSVSLLHTHTLSLVHSFYSLSLSMFLGSLSLTQADSRSSPKRGAENVVCPQRESSTTDSFSSSPRADRVGFFSHGGHRQSRAAALYAN